MNGLEVEVHLSCFGKIRRSVCMEQNEEERGGSCGLRITGTRQSFGFYSKYGRESFQDFEQKSEGVKKKKKKVKGSDLCSNGIHLAAQ